MALCYLSRFGQSFYSKAGKQPQHFVIVFTTFSVKKSDEPIFVIRTLPNDGGGAVNDELS